MRIYWDTSTTVSIQVFDLKSNCRAGGNQIFEPNLGNETVLGTGRKLREATEYFFEGSEKRLCRLSFEFYSTYVIETHSNI